MTDPEILRFKFILKTFQNFLFGATNVVKASDNMYMYIVDTE